MKVLLQKNIWREYAYDRFVQSLQDTGAATTEVNVIPFTDHFEDENIGFVPDCIFGSTRFVHLCRKHRFNTYRSFEPIEPFYDRNLWINGDNLLCKWKDIGPFIARPLFLKPVTEKFFTGCVIECIEDLDKVQLTTSFIDDPNEEMVSISGAVKIDTEVRFFVVGGQIITGSVYRNKGLVVYNQVFPHDPAWQAAQQILAERYIDDAFCLDIGLVDGQWKIVELNNVNSAGFYSGDTDVLARAFYNLCSQRS